MPGGRALVALVLAGLLGACGVVEPPAGADAGSPTAAPVAQATGGPGGSDRVPTPAVTPLGDAERDATATAQAGATPTAFSAADMTAIAAATAAVANGQGTTVAGAPPDLATRTPVVGAPEVLPAPLYLRSSEPAQVLRLERNAADYRQITFEQQPVVELAVPARGSAIFYLVGDPGGAARTLVMLGGAGRRELLYGELSSLVVSPDGQQIYVRIDNPEPGLVIGRDDSPPGVWVTSPAGLRPGLVLADAPGGDGEPAWTYTPIGLSPDGARLALYAYDREGPAIPGGEIVILAGEAAPVRGPTCCEWPVWSADGATLYSAGGGPGPDLRYGLYATDAATGAERAVLDGGQGDTIPLVVAPQRLADGELYAFVELAPAEGFGWEHPFRPALARVGPDGAVTPLAPAGPPPSEVLWEEQGAGAALVAPAPQYDRPDQLYWQPADGAPAVLIPFAGGDLAWVPAGAPLAAGDCAVFGSLGYQEGAARAASAAVFDLQGRLRSLGFDAGLADGFYGEQTRAAVTAFQQARGLPATGDVDCATWQAMLALP